MAAPAPPKPAPKPGRVKVFRALYDYTGRSDQEMSFQEGDILYVNDNDAKGDWYPARCGERVGLVPCNYGLNFSLPKTLLVVSENVEQIANPIHEAAKRGNMSFLRECIQNQVSVNSLDKSGSTALYWASHGGHLDIVNYLLTIPNISVTSQNKIGDTALHAASWRGHAEVVRRLLEAGANPSVKNQERKTPLDVARDAETAAPLQAALRANVSNEDQVNEYADEDDEED